MKRIVFILINLLIITSIFAQTPEKMSYQAVIRDGSDALVTNTQIGMQINIRKTSPTGSVVYAETQTPTTNANGLVSIEIGGGTGFSSIDWSSNTYYIETKTAVVPPLTTYTITGVNQILSVPFALHAKTAESVTGTVALTIGDNYQGGIVFWLDATGQHGLIAAMIDQSTAVRWYNGIDRTTATAGDGLYAGAMNTAMIVATQMVDDQAGNFAAKVCADYSVTQSSVIYGDWYLPSKFELNLLYQQKITIGNFSNNSYWTSNESSSSGANRQDFTNGNQGTNNKYASYPVRCIRSF